jgi:phenylacetate-CoA ligase
MNSLRYHYDAASFVAGVLRTRRHTRASPEALRSIQETRLGRHLAHARERSPFYRRLYAEVPSSVSLRDLERLPTVTKTDVLEHFDEVVTDPSISKDAVLEFAEDPSNVGRTFRGKYYVARTSGTTGHVGHYLHDLFSYWLCFVLTTARNDAARILPLGPHGWPRRLRLASVLSPSANFGVASVIAAAPRLARPLVDLKLLDILRPWDETVRQLNEYQPDVIGSMPTILEQLADSQSKEELRIRPARVSSGGEILTSRLRRRLEEAFRCPVSDAYGCAECCWLGMECREKDGIHVFADWFIVEAVDADGRPVPPGIESDKILLTNLVNRVQPFIRFEITDRVTVLEGPCRCGSPFPRVTVKGRASEVLELLRADGRVVKVPPFHLATLAEMTAGLERYQVVQKEADALTVSFTVRRGADAAAVYDGLKGRFENYLEEHGLGSAVRLEVVQTASVHRDPSGKTRQVISLVQRPAATQTAARA